MHPGRGPDGRFAPKAAEPVAPVIRTEPISAEVQAKRDEMYDSWPEMAVEQWGPRPERKTPAAEPKPEPKPDAPGAAAKPDAKTEQPKAQDAPKVEPAGVETVARDKAVKALILDGYTDDDLAALKQERVIALGTASIARHAAVDQKLANAGRESKQQTATSNVEESAPRQLPDDLQSVVKELSEEIGSEKAGKALEKILLRYEAREETRAMERVDQELRSARAALRESLPGLADEGTFEKVIDEIVDLRSTKRWGSSSLADVMQAAYSIVVPPPTPAQLLVDRLQTDGLATAPPAAPPAPKYDGPKKGDDPIDTVYEALRHGLDPKEAAKLGRVALGR
jgi:hypothetical protein